ncbi:MAG: universal stress protein [Bacteroidota bacterium]
MKTFKNILCPYDFSDYADEALLFAFKLADKETSITLANAIQVPYSIDPYGFTYFDSSAEDIKKSSNEALEKKVEAIKLKHHDLNINYKSEVIYDPAEFILKTQKEGHYDLLVIGSHGRKGLSRLLMGSVAESVLREATCPVIIIKK